MSTLFYLYLWKFAREFSAHTFLSVALNLFIACNVLNVMDFGHVITTEPSPSKQTSCADEGHNLSYIQCPVRNLVLRILRLTFKLKDSLV